MAKTEFVDARGVKIDSFEAVPSTPGIGIIRLPRCQNCFDELHDYSFGSAYCIPAELSVHREQKRYVRMGMEQRQRWEQVEREEQERREKETK